MQLKRLLRNRRENRRHPHDLPHALRKDEESLIKLKLKNLKRPKSHPL
jgi:hypothetical protein